MPADLLESNLFGHVKGSFTGAVSNKKGLFEMAQNGSIFFDEIGNIPLDTQAKLLRVIQEKEFMRLGGVETLKADVRIIAATNANLEEEVQNGEFREDLYYRLNVITIGLPPLRQRTEDIPLLVRHFLSKYSDENEKSLEDVDSGAMEILMDYHWPGNVRELENVLERAAVLSTGPTLSVDLLPPQYLNCTYDKDADQWPVVQRGHYILRASTDHSGSPALGWSTKASRTAPEGQAHDAP
jgi:transcriptional regulator with PAS, ATPase and Fis domain